MADENHPDTLRMRILKALPLGGDWLEVKEVARVSRAPAEEVMDCARVMKVGPKPLIAIATHTKDGAYMLRLTGRGKLKRQHEINTMMRTESEMPFSGVRVPDPPPAGQIERREEDDPFGMERVLREGAGQRPNTLEDFIHYAKEELLTRSWPHPLCGTVEMWRVPGLRVAGFLRERVRDGGWRVQMMVPAEDHHVLFMIHRDAELFRCKNGG